MTVDDLLDIVSVELGVDRSDVVVRYDTWDGYRATLRGRGLVAVAFGPDIYVRDDDESRSQFVERFSTTDRGKIRVDR